MTYPQHISNLIKRSPDGLTLPSNLSAFASVKQRQKTATAARRVLQAYKDSTSLDLTSSERTKMNQCLKEAGYAANLVVEAIEVHPDHGKTCYKSCQNIVAEIAAILSISPQQLQVAAMS